MTDLLSFQNVAKTFAGQSILKDFSLNIPPGEYFALAGANGAGKTTLIKMALDLIRADSGEVRLFGLTSTQVASRENLIYLPERFSVPAYLTGTEYIQFVLGMYALKYNAVTTKKACERLDLDPHVLNKKVSEYSKGMSQKLGLMACFLAERQLLILDEPMSGLDPKARYLVKQYLTELKQTGTTVFYSTHMLADAEDLCDRVGILDGGNLRYEGTPQDCMQAYAAKNLEEAYMRCVSR